MEQEKYFGAPGKPVVFRSVYSGFGNPQSSAELGPAAEAAALRVPGAVFFKKSEKNHKKYDLALDMFS